MWGNAGQYIRDDGKCNVQLSPDVAERLSPIVSAISPAPSIPPSALTISRRHRTYGIKAVQCPIMAVHGVDADVLAPRRIETLQALWAEHVQAVYRASEPNMWRVFCAVKSQSRVVQSAVLSSVRKAVDPLYVERWPKDRRQVDKLVSKSGGFRSRIMRSVKIDLSDVGFHGDINFEFVDPIYAWASTAFRVGQSGPLHFESQPYFNDAGERLYGRSVQSGDFLFRACEHVQARMTWDEDLPRGPALFGLSWDGGNASKRRSYTPIIISVGNTDSASCDTCCCIAYLPSLPAGTDSDVRRVLVQRCISAITKVLEEAAERGFTCVLPDYGNCGQRRLWHLYPVLARCELDTKERYKFFGGARQRSCGVGSGPRVGRSSFRPCTTHSSRTDLETLRSQVSVGGDNADAAAASLKRRGCHPHIACPAITDHCKNATLTIPGRVFSGLYAYDILHVVYIGAIGYCLEAVVALLTPSKLKRLDAIAAKFSPFRDHITGKNARRIVRVTQLSYLTGELRVVVLFTMVHAIGHRAALFPEATRSDVLTCMSCMQIICSVIRGKRPFTEAEHNYVFHVIGKEFWCSLSRLAAWKETRKNERIRQKNARLPPSKRKREKWSQCKPADPNESSDTADSDAGDARVPPQFIRSDKIITHAFLHLPEQVKLGGTYHFHNTSAVESRHIRCIQLAGTRVRKYLKANETEKSMLQYSLDMQLFHAIEELLPDGMC